MPAPALAQGPVAIIDGFGDATIESAGSAAVATAVAAEPIDYNPTDKEIALTVPMRDNVPRGQVNIRITPDDQILVSLADVIAALDPVTTTAFQATLRNISSPDGYVPLSAIQTDGLIITYDPSALELVLDLSASTMRSNIVNLGLRPDATPVEPDISSPFALSLSYQGSWDYVHRGQEKGLRSPRIDFNFDGRIANMIAFENELTYDGEADTKLYRTGSRLIYDKPEWAMRFTAGDQIPVQTGFQDSFDIAGIGAARLLETFRPDRTLASTSSRSITLREAATVTVVVNGVPTRTVRLGRGVFDLNQLPLTQGANSVELVIEDDAGGRRVVAFDFFQDFLLLDPGVDEFDVQLGIRSDFTTGNRDYFTDEPAFSGFYRRGITPQLTLGVNTQVSRDVQQAGVEATLGTPIGLFTLEAAGSNTDGFGFGHAQRLQYRYSTPLEQAQGERRLDLLIEHRSRDFSSPATLIPTNPISWRFSGRYGQPLSMSLTASVGLDYSKYRDGQKDRYGVNGTITWNFSRNTSVSFLAAYDDREKASVGFNFIHRFGPESTLTGRYDSRSDQANLTYSHSPIKTLDVISYGADIQRNPGDIGVNANATYRSNRGDFGITHRTTYDTDSNDVSSQVTSLRARGTIAFADGRVAIGRYLTDAFAIISAHPSLGTTPVSTTIFVGDGIEGREIARTGALGPALVPLSSYNKQKLPVEVPTAPTGYDLGTGNFDTYPWLNSGFHFTVGSEFNITVMGNLADEKGEPLPLMAGMAKRVGDPKSPEVEVFSNRTGRFAASGLAPGIWEVTFSDGRTYRIPVENPQGFYVNVGTLRPTSGKSK